MAFSDKDYKKMANAIVDDYIDNDIPLEKGIKKIASDRNMNANETRRLTQQTNVETHQKLYEKRAADKCVTFDVADPDKICKNLFADKKSPAEEVHSKTAHTNRQRGRSKTAGERRVHDADHPRNKLVDYNTTIPDETKKEAHVYEAPKPDYEKYPNYIDQELKEKRANEKKLKQASEEIKDEMNISLANYMDKIEKFASRFRQVYGPDFKSFEKRALAIFGGKAEHPLSEIRKCLGKKDPSSETVKEAKNQYASRDEHTEEFRELIAEHQKAVKYAKSLKWCQDKINGRV